MQFKLTINSEDDCCKSRSDIAYILHYVACRLNNKKTSQDILDRNNNVVGKWEMIEDTYEVWDNNFHKGDTHEVVFGGTFEECCAWMLKVNTYEPSSYERYSIVKGPWDKEW